MGEGSLDRREKAKGISRGCQGESSNPRARVLRLPTTESVFNKNSTLNGVFPEMPLAVYTPATKQTWHSSSVKKFVQAMCSMQLSKDSIRD